MELNLSVVSNTVALKQSDVSRACHEITQKQPNISQDIVCALMSTEDFLMQRNKELEEMRTRLESSEWKLNDKLSKLSMTEESLRP